MDGFLKMYSSSNRKRNHMWQIFGDQLRDVDSVEWWLTKPVAANTLLMQLLPSSDWLWFAENMLMYMLDRNCSETPEMCHEESTCSLVPPEVCVAERPNNYRCVCNEGYTGDGSDCQGKQTAVSRDIPFK